MYLFVKYLFLCYSGTIEGCSSMYQCKGENEVCEQKYIKTNNKIVEKSLCVCPSGFERDASNTCKPGTVTEINYVSVTCFMYQCIILNKSLSISTLFIINYFN